MAAFDVSDFITVYDMASSDISDGIDDFEVPGDLVTSEPVPEHGIVRDVPESAMGNFELPSDLANSKPVPLIDIRHDVKTVFTWIEKTYGSFPEEFNQCEVIMRLRQMPSVSARDLCTLVLNVYNVDPETYDDTDVFGCSTTAVALYVLSVLDDDHGNYAMERGGCIYGFMRDSDFVCLTLKSLVNFLCDNKWK